MGWSLIQISIKIYLIWSHDQNSNKKTMSSLIVSRFYKLQSLWWEEKSKMSRMILICNFCCLLKEKNSIFSIKYNFLYAAALNEIGDLYLFSWSEFLTPCSREEGPLEICENSIDAFHFFYILMNGLFYID